MRVKQFGLALVLVSGVVASLAAQSTFKMLISLVDSDGAPVTSLTPDQVRVAEGGVDAKVTKVEAIEAPVKIELLLDNGSGLGDNLNNLRTGIRDFLAAIPEGVEVGMYTTAPQGRLLVKSTANRKQLDDAIGRLAPDGGFGRLGSALGESAERIEKEEGRSSPVIVAVATTAGSQQLPPGYIDKAIQRIRKGRATVYVIMLSDTLLEGGQSEMETAVLLAKMTGGRYEPISSGSGLRGLLKAFGEQIAKSGVKAHHFRLTVERPKGASGQLGKVGFSAGAKTATMTVIESVQ